MTKKVTFKVEVDCKHDELKKTNLDGFYECKNKKCGKIFLVVGDSERLIEKAQESARYNDLPLAGIQANSSSSFRPFDISKAGISKEQLRIEIQNSMKLNKIQKTNFIKKLK